ncbi:MAG: hypothetical protein EZS28_030620 [Streblomastix strix]|uniref:Transmembrane protein n=1 Tax=Streblomastix strix TaxID=222440 RepID=A0A5J4UU50_9EUKA|nr:MAG: hypothetical protein EZS28_030620 [Streblomastix strix]
MLYCLLLRLSVQISLGSSSSSSIDRSLLRNGVQIDDEINNVGIYIAFLNPFIITSSIAYYLALSYSDNSFLAGISFKDRIKVYEEGKKKAKILTQTQQTKLLLEARGGGKIKPKRELKRHVEQNNEEVEEQAEDERRNQHDYPMNVEDDECDDQQIY